MRLCVSDMSFFLGVLLVDLYASRDESITPVDNSSSSTDAHTRNPRLELMYGPTPHTSQGLLSHAVESVCRDMLSGQHNGSATGWHSTKTIVGVVKSVLG